MIYSVDDCVVMASLLDSGVICVVFLADVDSFRLVSVVDVLETRPSVAIAISWQSIRRPTVSFSQGI